MLLFHVGEQRTCSEQLEMGSINGIDCSAGSEFLVAILALALALALVLIVRGLSRPIDVTGPWW